MTDEPEVARPPAPEMTQHAIRRFRERIEPLDDDAILAWCELAWARRWKRIKVEGVHMPGWRSRIVRGKYKGRWQAFLLARAPGGKPVYLALSDDHAAVKTVLDPWHFNRMAPDRPFSRLTPQDRLIAKLLEQEGS